MLATCFRKLGMEYTGSRAGLPDLLLVRRRPRQAKSASSDFGCSAAGWDECNDRAVLQSLLQCPDTLGDSCDVSYENGAAHGNTADTEELQDAVVRTDVGGCAGVDDDSGGAFVCPVAEALAHPHLEWQAKFVEVKGASDSLSDKQIVWLNTIASTMSATSAAICHVTGTEKEKKRVSERHT